MSKMNKKAVELKGKARATINAAASGAKHVTERAIDRSRDAAHNAGRTMVKQGKRLQSI
jgi:hypothetical protein